MEKKNNPHAENSSGTIDHPLFTILALVMGELIWGIAGMILAIPMISIFKIICDYIDSLKPYGFLIGEMERKESVFIKKFRGKQAGLIQFCSKNTTKS